MKPFFVPEDFGGDILTDRYKENIARIANAKLEREGKIVYGLDLAGMYGPFETKYSKYKAILINIEPIEKCTHPKEKVRMICEQEKPLNTGAFFCDCGVVVTPESFKEINK